LPTLALCKLVVQCIRGGKGSLVHKAVRPVLAVAHGYFARISSIMPAEDFFDEITELVDMVVRL
jgi:hypothetical protein